MSTITKPRWAKNAIIDPRGWRDSKTGELLVSKRFTREQIEEYVGVEPEAEDVVDPAPVTETNPLDAMKKAELVEFAEQNEIEVDASLKKAEIRAVIDAALAE